MCSSYDFNARPPGLHDADFAHWAEQHGAHFLACRCREERHTCTSHFAPPSLWPRCRLMSRSWSAPNLPCKCTTGQIRSRSWLLEFRELCSFAARQDSCHHRPAAESDFRQRPLSSPVKACRPPVIASASRNRRSLEEHQCKARPKTAASICRIRNRPRGGPQPRKTPTTAGRGFLNIRMTGRLVAARSRAPRSMAIAAATCRCHLAAEPGGSRPRPLRPSHRVARQGRHAVNAPPRQFTMALNTTQDVNGNVGKVRASTTPTQLESERQPRTTGIWSSRTHNMLASAVRSVRQL